MATVIAGSDHPIDGFSIFTLILFFAVSELMSQFHASTSLYNPFFLPPSDILVIFPLHFPIPKVITRPLRNTAVRLRILAPLKTGLSGGEDRVVHKTTEVNGTQPIQDDTQTEPNNNASSLGATSPSNHPVPPIEEPNFTFPLGLSTAPVIGVLLLLATKSIPGSVVRDGIVGSQGVRPYDIMTLFLSLVSPTPSAEVQVG